MSRKSAVPVAIASAAATIAVVAAPAGATARIDSSDVYEVRPIVVRSPLWVGSDPLAAPADCLAETGGAFACHTPESIRAAYNVPETIDGVPAGTGQTVVIVVAFGSPTVASDLAAFSRAFALPDADLEIHYPGGKPTWNGHDTQLVWAAETSLDVQWAHAMAPGAKIALVVAANDHGATLDHAVEYAVDQRLGNVLSMSYGQAEHSISTPTANNGHTLQAQKAFDEGTTQGMSLFAASGDNGSDNGAGFSNFSFPASDPNVTAVGGSTLWSGIGLDMPAETVWGDHAACPLTCVFGSRGATGGAPSLLGTKDGSDVAYNASPYTGVYVYLGFPGAGSSGLYPMAGTSAGSPQWAAW